MYERSALLQVVELWGDGVGEKEHTKMIRLYCGHEKRRVWKGSLIEKFEGARRGRPHGR